MTPILYKCASPDCTYRKTFTAEGKYDRECPECGKRVLEIVKHIVKRMEEG